MKQNKKQSWFKENYIYVVIIGVLLIALIGSRVYQNSTSYICSKNPDKCVCEEWLYKPPIVWKTSTIKLGVNIVSVDFIESCNKFRKKTQMELDIDDCNNNPRENDLCKCEEWKIPQCVIGGDANNNPIYQKQCIKSRPKTECEKGNLDWVEEIDHSKPKTYKVEIDGYINGEYKHPTEIKYFNFTSELAKFCDLRWDIQSRVCETKQRAYVLDYNNIQTICREKTK